MITAKGTGIIHLAQEILEQQEYAEIIKSIMPPQTQALFSGGNYAFINVGPTSYRTGISRLLAANDIQVRPGPDNSAELNF